MSEFFEKSLKIHRERQGKWRISSKVDIQTKDDLSIAYTPGVAAISEKVANDLNETYALTMKGNSVAIVSDGSAVLGLGNIGPKGAIPVMEGKAILFREFADIDGVPIVLDVHSVDEIVNVVKAIAPTFGGVNLEDIAAPKCFEIEEKLQDIGIPVFHDDQHGTAIVVLAAIINACKVTGKKIEDLKVVINGSGAAGIAIAKLLKLVGSDTDLLNPVQDVIVCDTKGIISKDRDNLTPIKKELLSFSNNENISGDVHKALIGADVFIGVSVGNLLTTEDMQHMAKDPIILAMANPIPEIMPDHAEKAGAAVVGTGRSDFPNQVNNALAFPGIFRGALDARATKITDAMKLAAAFALADSVDNLSKDTILPYVLDHFVSQNIAKAVYDVAVSEGICLKNEVA
jgi:malate dehydrogenase (oxaloacetate-decarboxylating)